MTTAVKIQEGEYVGWLSFREFLAQKLIVQFPDEETNRILFDDKEVARAFARRIKRLRPHLRVWVVNVP